MERSYGRGAGDLRPVTFEPGIAPHAAGSVLVSFGNTRVVCAATIDEAVPRWMQVQKVSGGWLTAEYSMLPYSTLDRKARDISRGKLDGRTTEIQRLIGRALRAVVLGALALLAVVAAAPSRPAEASPQPQAVVLLTCAPGAYVDFVPTVPCAPATT